MFAVVGIGAVVYGARTWMPDLASRHGAGIDAMLRYLLVTVGALLLVCYLVLAYFIWRGSGRSGIGQRLASRRVEIGLSVALGVGMAVIAEGGVLAIGMPVWAEYFDVVAAGRCRRSSRSPRSSSCGTSAIRGRTASSAAPIPDESTTRPTRSGSIKTDPNAKDDIVTLNDITVPLRAARCAFDCTRRT